MKKSIAVLLTCHNRRDKTIMSLNALFKADLPETYLLEVFLVDDGSTDGTGDVVREHYPMVNVIKGSGNLYWNRGMCLAWQRAIDSGVDFDFYLWLNDDTFLFKNSLEIILKDSNKLDNLVIISGVTCSPEVDSLITYGGRSHKGEIAPKVLTGEPQICESINGNFVLVPKSIYNKIGILDDYYVHSLGDHDYGIRAEKEGFKSYVSSDFIGVCESNNQVPLWCLESTPLFTRIKSLYSPSGHTYPPAFFIYKKRLFGWKVASRYFITLNLRMLFPFLWRKV